MGKDERRNQESKSAKSVLSCFPFLIRRTVKKKSVERAALDIPQVSEPIEQTPPQVEDSSDEETSDLPAPKSTTDVRSDPTQSPFYVYSSQSRQVTLCDVLNYYSCVFQYNIKDPVPKDPLRRPKSFNVYRRPQTSDLQVVPRRTSLAQEIFPRMNKRKGRKVKDLIFPPETTTVVYRNRSANTTPSISRRRSNKKKVVKIPNKDDTASHGQNGKRS